MGKFNEYLHMLNEAPMGAPSPPGGSSPLGSAPPLGGGLGSSPLGGGGLPPLGGGGLPPLGGGGLGPPPMGGGMGGQPPQTPQVFKIESPDVWDLLEKILFKNNKSQKTNQ